jgi:TRAP-type C4-dicarboxylate transport system permease small subunit
MNEEDEKLLKYTLSVVEENNKMLRKIRGVQKRASLMSLIYWFFIIGAAIGAFYFIQPYVDKIEQAFRGTAANINTVQNAIPK